LFDFKFLSFRTRHSIISPNCHAKFSKSDAVEKDCSNNVIYQFDEM
jgi:hypothetical protein